MIDQKKRNTMKAIVAGGALAVTPSAVAALSAAGKPGEAAKAADLELIVIDSKLITDDTLIVTNQSDRAINIEHFSPGMIAWEGKNLMLNEVLFTRQLSLPPGHSMSALVDLRWQSDMPPTDYLWLDQAREPLSEGTDIVRFSGNVYGADAILFSDAEALKLA